MHTHTRTHLCVVMIVGNSNLATKFVFWLACDFYGHLLNESNVAFVGFLGLPVDRSILSLFLLTCRLFHLKHATRRHHGDTIFLILFLRGCRRWKRESEWTQTLSLLRLVESESTDMGKKLKLVRDNRDERVKSSPR